MRHYKREYSGGGVRVQVRRGKAQWVMSIDERTYTEAIDKRGVAIVHENGKPKLNITRRTLRRVISDVPASEGSNRGKREAERRFRDWVSNLEKTAELDYETAVANDAATHKFSYAQMTVSDFILMYLEELKADGAERSTIDGYTHSTTIIRNFFKDNILGELTEEDLKSFDRHFRAEGLSDTTRGKALRILKQAMKAHRKQIGNDPFEEFEIPAPNGPDPNPLDKRSLETVKRAVELSDPTEFMTAVEMGFRTGMRIGEICGLRWSNVNLETGDIYVCNAIGREKGGTVLYEKSPKSNKRRKHKPERMVPGSPKIQEMLKRRFDYMVKEYMTVHQEVSYDYAFKYVHDNCYVVGPLTPNREGKYFANPTVMGRTWRGYSQGLTGTKGRRPTFHDLRHTYATYAIAGGIDPVTVASILGHSNPAITMTVYADALTQVKQDAQAKMDAIF